MALREQIRSTPEYQAQQAQTQAQASTQEADDVGQAISPLLDLEKGDMEFWLQVAQLVVLVLILRELRGP